MGWQRDWQMVQQMDWHWEMHLGWQRDWQMVQQMVQQMDWH